MALSVQSSFGDTSRPPRRLMIVGALAAALILVGVTVKVAPSIGTSTAVPAVSNVGLSVTRAADHRGYQAAPSQAIDEGLLFRGWQQAPSQAGKTSHPAGMFRGR
jgi:hypothetical protein